VGHYAEMNTTEISKRIRAAVDAFRSPPELSDDSNDIALDLHASRMSGPDPTELLGMVALLQSAHARTLAESRQWRKRWAAVRSRTLRADLFDAIEREFPLGVDGLDGAAAGAAVDNFPPNDEDALP